MIHFFTKEEEAVIIDAIRAVEKNTSGEIRVHLADNAGEEIMTNAYWTFRRLEMHKTKERNGVLIYLSPKKHCFAIIGDTGIDKVVPDHFWDEVCRMAEGHFRRGEFVEGVCLAVDRVGSLLREHFPDQDNRDNELPDELSYG